MGIAFGVENQPRGLLGCCDELSMLKNDRDMVKEQFSQFGSRLHKPARGGDNVLAPLCVPFKLKD